MCYRHKRDYINHFANDYEHENYTTKEYFKAVFPGRESVARELEEDYGIHDWHDAYSYIYG